MYYLQIRLMERIKDTLKPLTWSSIAPPPSTPLNSVRSSKYSVAHGAPNRHFLPLLALSLPFLFNFDRQLSLWWKYCHIFQETSKAFILIISQILTCIMFNGDEMQSFAIVIAELSPVKKTLYLFSLLPSLFILIHQRQTLRLLPGEYQWKRGFWHFVWKMCW